MKVLVKTNDGETTQFRATADDVNYPGTYFAGLYDRAESRVD